MANRAVIFMLWLLFHAEFSGCGKVFSHFVCGFVLASLHKTNIRVLCPEYSGIVKLQQYLDLHLTFCPVSNPNLPRQGCENEPNFLGLVVRREHWRHMPPPKNTFTKWDIGWHKAWKPHFEHRSIELCMCSHQNDAGKQWGIFPGTATPIWLKLWGNHRVLCKKFKIRRRIDHLKRHSLTRMNILFCVMFSFYDKIQWMYLLMSLCNESECIVISVWPVFPCLRSGSVKNHWDEIYYFVENLAEKFKR